MIKNTKNQRTRQLVAKWKSDGEYPILEAIAQTLPQHSRTSQKQLLRDRCVTCNGNVCENHNLIIQKEDLIEIFNIGFLAPLNKTEAKVLWEDDYFILVHKNAGINTIATHEGDKNTVYRIVADYYKSADIREKIFLLNRLDRDSEGLILFARNREIQQEFLDNWGKYMLSQTFSAVVEGNFLEPEGVFEAPATIERNKNKSNKLKKGALPSRRSKVSYTVEQNASFRSLLSLQLHGRYNGIRTQLNECGHPILGEKNKGVVLKGSKRLALIQRSLSFLHPVTYKKHHFTLALPQEIKKLLLGRTTANEKKLIKEKNETLSQKESPSKKIQLDTLTKIINN